MSKITLILLFLLKIPQKHTLSVNFIIHIIPVTPKLLPPSTLRHRISIVRSQKSHLFYSFLLKTPQKHTLCVNFIIFITSVIISNPRSVFVLSLEIPLSSLDFLLTYSQKITFYDIFCLKCPKNSLLW